MRKTVPAALLLALLSTVLGAAEPRIGKFVRYDAGDFTIVTSRSASQARSFVEDLRKFKATLEKMLDRRVANVPIPTTIVIVSQHDWISYLMPREGVAGFFQSIPFANYMAMNGDAQIEEATPVMFHEYTHYFLASQFSGVHPPWFNEGIAEVMAFTSFKVMKGTAVLQIPMFRVREARDRDWIPFERLIKVDHFSPEYQSHKLADSFYAQAWLTVHYGLIGNPAFGRQMFAYLQQLNTLHPHEDAVRNSFGTDLEAIDRQLREYSRKNDLRSGALKMDDIPAVELPAGQPVAANDAYALLIDLMLETRGHPDRIRPLVAALSKREPKSARAAILTARLAAIDEDEAAFEAAVTAAESTLSPGDWQARRDLAGVLMRVATEFRPLSKRTSEDETRDLERALKWFSEAVAHNDRDIVALWGFGTAATRLGKDLDQAENALVAAYKLAPASAQIAMSLANLNARRNEPDAMVPYLEDTIRYATDLSMRRWAAETLLELRKFLAERDAIDAQNEAQRKAYEKQLADYEKKYGKRKKK